MRFPDYPKSSEHPYYNELWERLVYEMGRIPKAEDMTILTVRHGYSRTALERIKVLARSEHHALMLDWQNVLEFVVFMRRRDILEKAAKVET